MSISEKVIESENNININYSLIESEINTWVKEATDIMCQKFVEATQEQLYSIKQ